MRVLYWTEQFWPYIGGVEVRSAKLLPALRARGHEFIVVTSHAAVDLPNEGQYKGIPVYRFDFRQALTRADMDLFEQACQELAKVKRGFAPNLIHIQGVGSSIVFHLRTDKVHPAPLLVTVAQELARTRRASISSGDALLSRLLCSANWVTCVSSAVLAHTRQLVPEITPYSSLLYNSLESPSLLPEPLPDNPPRLLCLGRLIFDKGFDLALSALAMLVALHPQVEMVIAGDGPARPDLERQAAALGLAERVSFVGWVVPERVPALLNTATVVVMPSRREGFGLVALEAALMARPVVATRVGGLPEVVAHDQTGLLVAPDDSHALAEAIAWLLAHPERAAEIGQVARRRALEIFNWERCVDAYDALYRKVATRDVAHMQCTDSPALQ